MKSERRLLRILPFHDHVIQPWNSLGRGDCCEAYDPISDGFYCSDCNHFFHKKCCIRSIQHPSHPDHTLNLGEWKSGKERCSICGRKFGTLCYRCKRCDFFVDMFCAKHPPPEVLDVPEVHAHRLTLLKERIEFKCCADCGKICDDEFPYKCQECDLCFHVNCVWHHPPQDYPSEVNSPYHSPQHPLYQVMGSPPNDSDEKCRLCGKGNIDRFVYHCSPCNFTLCFGCFENPPPKSLLDSKAHDHQLTLLPRLDPFTCNACGVQGDRSPYACFECGFMIHQSCLSLPRVININRHDHRVSRTSALGVVNSVCGVCHRKMNRVYGGYFCKRCPGYVVHSKCATRKDVWNGKELEDVPEEIEDTRPYVVIDDNTIQHFSHKDHYLRLSVPGILYEGNKWCNACAHPLGLQSFYDCKDCDFRLHQNCAECPTKTRHVLHNDQLVLVTSMEHEYRCDACHRGNNGFMYQHRWRTLDVKCGSISEPFFHPSHPQHPLYYIPTENDKRCNGCQEDEEYVLRCIDDGCKGFVLGFKCATLPQVVKHRVDDHPLSLCYSEKASGEYWCDICETKTNPEKWFYTCKDHRASLHMDCVVGTFAGLIPGSTIKYGHYVSYEVVLNNSASRPICERCKSRCMSPIILKNVKPFHKWVGAYFCSWRCLDGR